MKHFLTFLFLCCTFVCASSQNVKGLNINQSFFPFEMIDSITYTNQSDIFLKIFGLITTRALSNSQMTYMYKL